MRTIAIANQKGGCGKTITAINLSAALARNGQRTLLIDLDPQAHASLGLGMRTESLARTIYNTFIDTGGGILSLADVILNLRENFDLAPSHILLSTLEQLFANQENAASRLWESISSLEGIYDFVIIDCPPSLGFLTFNALRASNESIIPVEASYFSVSGVDKLNGLVELVDTKLGHKIKIGVLVTMFDRRSNFSKRILEQIRENFKDTLFKTIIRSNVTLREAAFYGRAVFEQNRFSRGAEDYQSLTEEVLKEQEAPPKEEIVRKHMERLFYYAPGAHEVYVLGEFNNWTPDANSKLIKNEDGRWIKALVLRPGRYRYKFVVDGQWREDPNNQLKIPNPFGGIDSVIEV